MKPPRIPGLRTLRHGTSLSTPVHHHLHTGRMTVQPAHSWWRIRREKSVAILTFKSFKSFFNCSLLFNRSDFEGMFRMMLTKACSQPESGLIWTGTCRTSVQGETRWQVKGSHLKPAKGQQVIGQTSREENKILRRGKGLHYHLSKDHW